MPPIADHTPLHVFKIFFWPSCAHSRAEFELVALPYATPEAVRQALHERETIRALRLVAWRAPGDKSVRLIDRTWVIHFTYADVAAVEPCDMYCMFRPSAAREGAVF